MSLTAHEAMNALAFAPGTHLGDLPTGATPGAGGGKSEGQAALAAEAADLTDLQERLWAAGTAGGTPSEAPSVLVVLQGMDSAGKGGIVSHVVGQVHPMGVRYTAFKKPTATDLEHDFLWRIRPHVPPPGILGVFDRSHYEDVLVARVRQLVPAAEIERRYGAIGEFEAELAGRGVAVLKVMLHLGRDEQRDRLAARLTDPAKRWKFNPGDVDERLRWDDYATAYQLMLERTTTPVAPWYVVPADHKWYARLAVQRLLVGVLRSLDLDWPVPRYDVGEQQQRLSAS